MAEGERGMKNFNPGAASMFRNFSDGAPESVIRQKQALAFCDPDHECWDGPRSTLTVAHRIR
jgi:hypothetical protein